MSSVRTLFWFRRDLRLDDNAGLWRALEEARAREGTCACLFLFDRDILDHLEPDDRRIAWIHASLVELADKLAALGSRLLCLHGRAPESLTSLLDAFPEVRSLHCNHDQEAARLARDAAVEALCRKRSVALCSGKDATVLERDELLKADGTPYRVYTPFRNAWRARVASAAELLAPFPSLELARSHLAPARELPDSGLVSLEALGFRRTVAPVPTGETASLALWQRFLPGIAGYEEARDIPARDGTSSMGTALRFGTIPVRRLFRESLTQSVKWSDELIWREFHHSLLAHFPRTATRAFQEKFETLEWDDPESDPTARERLEAWQEGRTGFPAVDAPMRELAVQGTMPNRLRMVVASFLTKDLHLHWRHGERWFARHLMDYDMASNVGNWQWTAGTGADAQPWFRIFNPTSQGRRWDPAGHYLLRWCPELSGLPPARLHEPWSKEGLPPGLAYPRPIVDHARERSVTLERFARAAGSPLH